MNLFRTDLPRDLTASSVARRFTSRALAGAGECDTEAILLMVSELVANAVEHSPDPLLLSILVGEGQVRVEVSDSSMDLPAPSPLDVEAEGGRGLLIIDALASNWGTSQFDRMKIVWFTMPLSDPTSA